MDSPDRRPVKVSAVQEQSAALRSDIEMAVNSASRFRAIVPRNVFAMTFATGQDLINRMRGKKMSMVIIAGEQLMVEIGARPEKGQTDFVKALHDGKYRQKRLERWYRSLCAAYQNPNEEASYEAATSVLADSAVPLGLVADEKGISISMFDAEEPQTRSGYSEHFAVMQRSADHGLLDTKESIFYYLSGLWDVMVRAAPEKASALADIAPPQVAGSAPDELHAW